MSWVSGTRHSDHLWYQAVSWARVTPISLGPRVLVRSVEQRPGPSVLSGPQGEPGGATYLLPQGRGGRHVQFKPPVLDKHVLYWVLVLKLPATGNRKACRADLTGRATLPPALQALPTAISETERTRVFRRDTTHSRYPGGRHSALLSGWAQT